VNDKRPVNLDISTMRLPLTSWVSIAHRASGVILFVAMAILLWMLGASLESPESFAELEQYLSSPLAKLVIWGIVSALIYHSVAGVKHLIADFGIGETMEGGLAGAKIAIGVSVVLILLAGVWIW
jgi:succinate dehydrogenase / fumarate reductase cytochrome b subunit